MPLAHWGPYPHLNGEKMNKKSALSLFTVGLSTIIISGCVGDGGSYEPRSAVAYRERVIIETDDDRRPHRRQGFDREDRDIRMGHERDRRHTRETVRNDRDGDRDRPDNRRCRGPRCPDDENENRQFRPRF